MIPQKIKEIAKGLRNNMTKGETLLWDEIKNDKLWIRILRQKPICLFIEWESFHRYIIPDFYIATKKIIIEVDWNVHDIPETVSLDKVKEQFLLNNWFKILRFRNEEIYFDLQNIISKIKESIK